jgi:hypothetical protein
MQAVHNVGPIPQGGESIEGPPTNTAKTWALRTALEPRLRHRHVRRSGCLKQGDSKESPGCVITPPPAREQLRHSGDTELEVLAEFQTQDVQQDKSRVRVRPERTSFRPTNARSRPELARMIGFRE